MRLLKRERDALSALLVQGAESPEALVEEFVRTLDELRGARSHHYACLIVAGVPVSVGPFSTDKQAAKVVEKIHADKAWVVGGWTPEGFTQHLDDVDKAVEPFKLNAKERDAQDKAFWGKVSRIREGDTTAITGKVEVKPLKLPKGCWG